MASFSGLPGVTDSTTSIVSSDATTSPAYSSHSTSPGTGAMQGTMVGVGDGGTRTALLNDSSNARGMFGNVLGLMGNVWGAAGALTGFGSTPKHAVAQDPAPTSNAKAHAEVDGWTLLASAIHDNDTAVSADSQLDGWTLVSTEDKNKGAAVLTKQEAADTIAPEADSDGDVFHDFPDDDEEIFEDFPDDDETATPVYQNIDGGKPGVNGVPQNVIGGLPASDGAQNVRPVVLQLDDELDIPLMSLSTFMRPDETPTLALGDKGARDASENQIQEQQAGLMARALGFGGWMLGGAAGVMGGVVGMAGGVVGSVATVAKDALVDALPAALTGQETVQSSTDATPAAPVSLANRNLEEAEKVSSGIRDKMHKLNLQLTALGYDLATKSGKQPKELLDAPQLNYTDTGVRWYHQARGALSAVMPTLGIAAAGAGVAVVGDAVGTVTASLPLKALALLGGGYLGLSALADYPELATDHAARTLIKATLTDVQKDMARFDDLVGQERARFTAEARALVVSDARTPRLQALQAELSNVTEALEKIENGEVSPVAPVLHQVEISDGAARTQTLGLADRARAAFSSAFASIARGLENIGRFVEDLSNVFERRAADKAEQAYAHNARDMLRALQKAPPHTLLSGGIDVRARERAEAHGARIDTLEVRKQFHMGENLALALINQEGQAFGAVKIGTEGNAYAAAATLTTARALAWYLESIAPTGHANDPTRTVPQVTRNADGSLTINDPDRKLYSFLMNVPSAHTSAMDSTEGRQSVGFTIDDHRQGMPQGMHGMRFEIRLGTDGTEQLHMSFIENHAAPVFAALGDESDMLMQMHNAIHSSEPQPVTQGQDRSTWPEERLRLRQAELVNELQREITLYKGDQAQVAALGNWQNPTFFSGRV
ncbi:hypothetical protein ACQUFY_17040 [Robbsia andropogonis]|uniref:hypothetical protein n=1 Tax=Robbsia andropogonis TaxID=28092 RepID=UPI003D1DB0FF